MNKPQNELEAHYYLLMLIREKELTKEMRDVFWISPNLQDGYAYLEGACGLSQLRIALRAKGGILLCILPKDFPRPKLLDYKPLLEAMSSGSY